MKPIEEKVFRDALILNNEIVKVDGFLNHQIEFATLRAFAEETKAAFGNQPIDLILTIETSGIAVACAVAEAYGDTPILFAKKSLAKTSDAERYQTQVKSFTHGNVAEVFVAKKFLREGQRILIVDDFLAEGNAALGLLDLIRQAKAIPVGVAVVVEKTFQGGRERLQKEGLKVYAGASIVAFENNKPVFGSFE